MENQNLAAFKVGVRQGVGGQISGSYYGVSGIPTQWIDKLVQKDEILAIAERLYHASAYTAPSF